MSVETEPEYTLEFSNDHNETYVTNRGYRWKLDLARAYQDTRVIIVNENPQFGELATREFARRGISRAYTVTSVDDAITQVRNHPDSVNLLVLDPSLQDMNVLDPLLLEDPGMDEKPNQKRFVFATYESRQRSAPQQKNFTYRFVHEGTDFAPNLVKTTLDYAANNSPSINEVISESIDAIEFESAAPEEDENQTTHEADWDYEPSPNGIAADDSDQIKHFALSEHLSQMIEDSLDQMETLVPEDRLGFKESDKSRTSFVRRLVERLHLAPRPTALVQASVRIERLFSAIGLNAHDLKYERVEIAREYRFTPELQRELLRLVPLMPDNSETFMKGLLEELGDFIRDGGLLGGDWADLKSDENGNFWLAVNQNVEDEPMEAWNRPEILPKIGRD